MFAKRRTILCATAASAVALVMGASDVSAQDCVIASLNGGNATKKAEDNFSCLMSKFEMLEKAIVSEKARADQLEAALATASSSPALPRGAVVAFDRDDLSADKCPEGWVPFFRGRGRMIVGAGNPAGATEKFGFGEDGKSLANRDHRQHGGSETHTLTVDQLPSHAHTLFSKENPAASPSYPGPTEKVAVFGAADVGALAYRASPSPDQSAKPRYGLSGAVGSDDAHNNMPPYIALYFCKKEAG